MAGDRTLEELLIQRIKKLPKKEEKAEISAYLCMVSKVRFLRYLKMKKEH